METDSGQVEERLHQHAMETFWGAGGYSKQLAPFSVIAAIDPAKLFVGRGV